MIKPLDTIHIALIQLQSFRVLPKTHRARAYLEADIRGYEEVLASKSERNAEVFLCTKHKAIVEGKPFKDNEAVIRHLKSLGQWEYPEGGAR